MKPALLTGTIIVNLALICYTVFNLRERKTRKAGNFEITFLTLGVLFDITATTFMIIGSSKSPFTLHGILGYSSLAGMLTDSILMWRTRIKNPSSPVISDSLHRYSKIAYAWWIIAYLTGAILVMMR